MSLRTKIILGAIGLSIAAVFAIVQSNVAMMNHPNMNRAETQANDAQMSSMNHGGTIEIGGHDMSTIDVRNAPKADVNGRGNQLLVPTVADGVKEFNLDVDVVQWSILPDVTVGAYAYNNQVPGSLIRVNVGDKLRIRVKNNLPEPTSIHWHGLAIPNRQDGAADITQPPIQPEERFTYEFTVPDTPGTYFYHTHYAGDRQQPIGLYGALIIDRPNAAKDYDPNRSSLLSVSPATALH